MPQMIQPVSEKESRSVFRLFLYSFLLASSYTLSRTVADSLFLSRIGSENLALVFVLSGLTTAIAASIWYAATRKLRLGLVVQFSSVSFGILTLAAWWAIPRFHHSLWLFGAIYLLAEIKGCLNVINVVTAMNDVLGSRASRFSWARIGLGVPLASIAAGSMIGLGAGSIDLRNWLLIAAFLDFGASLPLIPLSKFRLEQSNPQQKSIRKLYQNKIINVSGPVKVYACSRQFRFWIAILISAKVVVLTLITFEWKVSVDSYYDGNEARLANFFGSFYAGVGLATVLLQLFVTGRLLTKRSIYIPILFMPVCLIFLNVLFIAGAGALFRLIVTTAAKSQEVWRRSVHDTTLNFLYTKIERTRRRSVIAFNSAVVKPLSEVAASLVLLLGSTIFHEALAILATVIWIIAATALLRLLRGIGRSGWSESGMKSGIKQLASGLADDH